MDSFYDVLTTVPMVPVCEAGLFFAMLLLLGSVWLLRRQRKLAAGAMVALGLILGAGSGIRLATWKELQPSQKFAAAMTYYNQVAVKHIAGLVRQQYPQHNVVAVFLPNVSADDPCYGLACLKAGLGAQTKVVAVNIRPDADSVKELLAERRRHGDNVMTEASASGHMNSFLRDWYCGRNFTSAVASAGLSGDIVVISFAGIPPRGTAEIKASGRPVLIVAGEMPHVIELIGDGTVATAVLSRPEASVETRCFHNQEKAFNLRWFLLDRKTAGEASRLLPLPDDDKEAGRSE